MRKTLVFVDGQNLFYSLKSMSLQERQINWDSFFAAILEKDDELVRAYWYQPQKLSEQKLTTDKAMRLVDQAGKQQQEILAEANNLVAKATAWVDSQKKKYEAQLHRYDEMSIKYPVIEMVRRGVCKIDPFKENYLGEKGVDVALAVHMIKFHEKCDKIILISGDLDYGEVIQFVKDNMKRVHIVRLFNGTPPSNRSVSRTLMAIADKVIDVYESQIKAAYLI